MRGFFANYDHGAPLTLEVENLTDNPPIKGEVVSRRRYSLGRPYTYGVRFLLDSTQDKDNYHHLIKHWKARKRRIKKLKYGD